MALLVPATVTNQGWRLRCNVGDKPEVSESLLGSQNSSVSVERIDLAGMPMVSVLLPVHNEAKTIKGTVTSFFNEFKGNLPVEFIVAEDGSVDGTREILSSLSNELPIVLLSDPNRKGYAKSVGDALRFCTGDWIFFSDSDGQYLPTDFWNLWEHRDLYDIIVGHKVHRREGAHRILLAKGFHEIVNAAFALNLHDADCGFRLLRKEVIHSIIDEVRFLKYSFWAEFTIRACLKGFKVCEVPINHSSRAHGGTQIYKLSKLPEIVLRQLGGLSRLFFDVRNGS